MSGVSGKERVEEGEGSNAEKKTEGRGNDKNWVGERCGPNREKNTLKTADRFG